MTHRAVILPILCLAISMLACGQSDHSDSSSEKKITTESGNGAAEGQAVGVHHFGRTADRQFPFWYVWTMQNDDLRQSERRLELQIASAEADLKKAQAEAIRAEQRRIQERMNEYKKLLAGLKAERINLGRAIKRYQLSGRDLSQVAQGKTGGNVINAFYFFLSKAGLEDSIENLPFDQLDLEKNFKGYSKTEYKPDGRVNVVSIVVKPMAGSYGSNYLGLLKYLRDTKVKVIPGSKAHQLLVDLRNELAEVATKLIDEDSAEIKERMQRELEIIKEMKEEAAPTEQPKS